MKTPLILITGATGYIGGRLVLRLLKAGYRVRAMARSMDKIKGRSWQPSSNLELVSADLLDPESLKGALKDCDIAYYLVHSMSEEHKDFVDADRRAAKNFILVSGQNNIQRIIYLGGLAGNEPNASLHLKSRAEVETILQSGRVPVTVFRCAHIIGSGSASFEMLRYITERMPYFIVPKSVIDTKIQPICIRNVLIYLEECLKKEETIGQAYDIGGPEILTYRQLFEIYAKQAGLRKPMIIHSPTPSFKLGTIIAHFIAKLLLPISPGISQPLLDGLGVEIVTKEDTIRDLIPQNLIHCASAIDRAIQKDSLKLVDTRWTDAGELNPPEWMYEGDAAYSGGTLLQGGYKISLACKPADIWPLITGLGGQNGWYYGDILWQVRGWMDQIAGGVGLRRGRRHPELLNVGDALDFWRVLDVHPPLKLILLAEMKLPGEALLNFELVSDEKGTQLKLGTRFRPTGLYGILYWYSLLPFHNLLFKGMLKALAKRVGKTILSGPEKYRPGPLLLDQ
ncbi:MAG: SDR family oxidoreductase [Proteobacteria bacterium]|nr:SDR family oxidoreductase [Pseudomonadota bacterium]MBU1581366.1 SDR family oxidoreductase [Pseudomonadota bacterium]MBU2629805.1 SDR family oxidoreductase [Pseudomonadota bacterium]